MTNIKAGMLVTPNVRLCRPLGAGGMGTVWVAEHTTLEREVAVKVIGGIEPSPNERARFEREAKAIARVHSPHVVQVFEYGVTDDGQPFIIMELLRGESLGERLDRGALSPQELSAILMQTANGLSAAHRSGVVHRDIKPSNIYLLETPSGEPFVKVLDFGIAKLLGRDWGDKTGDRDDDPRGAATTRGQSDAQLTAKGTVVGTPEYMSPEQLSGTEKVGFRSDIWSLGVVAFKALSGDSPFAGVTLPRLRVMICNGSYEITKVPEAYRGWFSRALAVVPDERFGSAVQAAESFRALVEQTEKRATTATPNTREPHDEAVTAQTSADRERGLGTERGGPRRPWLALALFVVPVLALAATRIGDELFGARSQAPELASTGATNSAEVRLLEGSTTSSMTASAAVSEVLVPSASVVATPASSFTASATAPQQKRTASKRCETLCSTKGQCHWDGELCVARSEGDCRSSDGCIVSGACSLVDGQCRAQRAADCRASRRCASYGKCGLAGVGCVATSDADCRRSTICRKLGRCSVHNDSCMALSDDDCRRSERCQKDGTGCTRSGYTCGGTSSK